MNILYLTNHLNAGGVTSYILTLVAGLKERGHNIYVASSGGLFTEKFKVAGAIYLPIPIKTKKEISPKILTSFFKLRSENNRYSFDIIHAHTRTTQVLAALLSRSLGIPYIVTCHGFFKRRILRRIFPCWGVKVIAISEQVREHLVKDFQVSENKIAVIHNGIDIGKFTQGIKGQGRMARLALGLGEGPVIGIVARLSDVKGHIYLIQAMKEVLHKLPQAQLLIVGEGKTKNELLKSVNDLGIRENVFFRPGVFDTKEVLSAMDVFVLPSLKEGLGLSLMEAMASGLAVIGSDVGGIKTLIRDGHTGLLVKPADSRDLSAKLLELLENDEKRNSLGETAQIFIAENFSADKMAAETLKLYLQCLDQEN